MQTLRLVEGKVPLHNPKAIHSFMKEVVNYEQYVCQQGFEPTPIEVSTGKFKLVSPFVDRSVPISSIKEFVWTIGLDANMHAYYIDLIGIGSINKSLVDISEVFRGTAFYAVHSVVLVHNHPSGDPNPSDWDIDLTDKVIELGMLLKRPLKDHLIITPDKYCSLVDNNLIQQLEKGILARRGKEDELYATIQQKDEDLQQAGEDLLEAYKEIEKWKKLALAKKG